MMILNVDNDGDGDEQEEAVQVMGDVDLELRLDLGIKWEKIRSLMGNTFAKEIYKKKHTVAR